MEVFDAIKARISARSYDPSRTPPEAVLSRVLESARLAPSAMNYQPWHFVVVRNSEKRAAMAKARYAGFLKEAPIVIVGCGDRKKSPKWQAVDVTIAMQNMVMAATSEGLGTCWIGSFDESAIREMLEVPDQWSIVALLAMGYAKKKVSLASLLARSRSRKALSEIVSYEEFGNPEMR